MQTFVMLATLLAGGLAAFIAGYDYGVRETEKRWSEAVSRDRWSNRQRPQ